MVSVQNPVRLSRYTEPQPDILLAPWRDDFYAYAGRLSAEDAVLVIEISDTLSTNYWDKCGGLLRL